MPMMLDMRGTPDILGECRGAGFRRNDTDCTQFFRYLIEMQISFLQIWLWYEKSLEWIYYEQFVQIQNRCWNTIRFCKTRSLKLWLRISRLSFRSLVQVSVVLRIKKVLDIFRESSWVICEYHHRNRKKLGEGCSWYFSNPVRCGEMRFQSLRIPVAPINLCGLLWCRHYSQAFVSKWKIKYK